MSAYSDLMDFIFDVTIKMLAGVTNAPVATEVRDGEGNVIKTTCASVIPMDQPYGAAGLKDAHTDAVFYNITPIDDPYNRQVNRSLVKNDDESVTSTEIRMTRALQISWACVGPDSFEWISKIELMLFDSAIHADFAAQGLALVPDVPSPRFVPEILKQEWLHRYDLQATFYQEETAIKTEPAVGIADIIIISEQGVEAECSVSQES